MMRNQIFLASSANFKFLIRRSPLSSPHLEGRELFFNKTVQKAIYQIHRSYLTNLTEISEIGGFASFFIEEGKRRTVRSLRANKFSKEPPNSKERKGITSKQQKVKSRLEKNKFSSQRR